MSLERKLSNVTNELASTKVKFVTGYMFYQTLKVITLLTENAEKTMIRINEILLCAE